MTIQANAIPCRQKKLQSSLEKNVSEKMTSGAGTVMESSCLPAMIIMNPVMPDPHERCQLTTSEIRFLQLAKEKRKEKEKKHQKSTTENKADNGECNKENIHVQNGFDIADTDLLYSLVQAEAGNQDLDGCRLVADVVLNRIDSGKFPNDLESVIYAPGQFSVVKNGALAKAVPSDKVKMAVDMELSQGRFNTDLLYFNNSDNGGWKYGGHWFK